MCSTAGCTVCSELLDIGRPRGFGSIQGKHHHQFLSMGGVRSSSGQPGLVQGDRLMSLCCSQGWLLQGSDVWCLWHCWCRWKLSGPSLPAGGQCPAVPCPSLPSCWLWKGWEWMRSLGAERGWCWVILSLAPYWGQLRDQLLKGLIVIGQRGIALLTGDVG